MKKKIGSILQQKVVDIYQAGFSIHKTSQQLGISSSSVLRVLKRHDVHCRGRYDYGYSKYKFDRDFFRETDSSIKAYWLGVLLADGYIDGKYKVRLLIASRDKDWLQLFVDDLEANIPIRYSSHHKPNDMVYIQINSKMMVQNLAQWGIIQKKTGFESFPYILNSYYPDFIRGVFDGDGSAGFYKDKRNSWQPHFRLCGSRDLLKRIKAILRKHCAVNDNKIAREVGIYTLGFAGFNQVERIYKFVYPDDKVRCLLRKRQILLNAFVMKENNKV